MSKDDYEYDWDDDGNEIKRRRITREDLKQRLKAAERVRDKCIKESIKAQDELRAIKCRQDNAYWCDRLKAVLDDGNIYPMNASVEIQTSYTDVTGMFDTMARSIPGPMTSILRVEFTGDEAVLRFAEFLKESR